MSNIGVLELYVIWLALMAASAFYIDSISSPRANTSLWIRVLCDIAFPAVCGGAVWLSTHYIIHLFGICGEFCHAVSFIFALIGGHVGARFLYQINNLINHHRNCKK